MVSVPEVLARQIKLPLDSFVVQERLKAKELYAPVNPTLDVGYQKVSFLSIWCCLALYIIFNSLRMAIPASCCLNVTAFFRNEAF